MKVDIDNILRTEKNPLISIVRTNDDGRIQRGMGFVYKNISRKIKVIATCKHNFITHPYTDFSFLIGAKSHLVKIISPPFYSDIESEDIALFIVEDSRRHQNIEFNAKPKFQKPISGQVLYNSKCEFNPHMPTIFPFYVMRQETFAIDMSYALSGFEKAGIAVSPGDESTQKEFIEKGCVVYPAIGMVSKVGCSGSPIFDDELNLYGINIRGANDSDVLIYVPISNVNRLYNKIMPEIKKFGL